MRKRSFDELRKEYLIKLYELTNGASYKDIKRSVINEALKISDDDEATLIGLLKYANIAEYTFGSVFLTPTGVYLAETYMAQDYADNELLVLNTIYEYGSKSQYGEVIIFDLARDLNMTQFELNEYLNELENEKKFIRSIADEAVIVTPRGKEFLQRKSNVPNQSVRDIYNTYINAPSNNQIGGQNNKQNAQINLNPDFDNAIKSVIQLINESSLSDFKKNDLNSTVEHIKQLPSSEPSLELAEHGKSKIDYVKLAVAGTDIALKIVPHLHTLHEYFDKIMIGLLAK